MPRKYSAILRFEDWQFYDDIDGNNWTVFGDRDIVRFTEDSPFNDVCDLQRNYMTIYNCNGYLYNDQDMYVGGDTFTIACWVKYEDIMLAEFYQYKDFYAPFLKWIDVNGFVSSVYILTHASTDDSTEFLRLTLGNKSFDIEWSEFKISNEWFHFMYTREKDKNSIFLNGVEVFSCVVPETNNFTYHITKFYLGCDKPIEDTKGIVSYSIDDFNILNDRIKGLNFFRPERPLRWLYPEVTDMNELFDQFDFKHYKYGAATGLSYIYFYPTRISGKYMWFSGQAYSQGHMLFMNSTFVQPERWKIVSVKISSSPDVYETRLELQDSKDAAIANNVLWTFVGIKQKTSEFSWNVQQVSTTSGQTEFNIPSSIDPLRSETFVAFDASLCLIQKDRYKVTGTPGNYKLVLTNKEDTPLMYGSRLTLVSLKRNSYSGSKSDLVTNRQFEFHKFVLPITKQGVAQFPIGRAHTSSYGAVGFTIESVLLFVDGTFMPTNSFTINSEGEVRLVLANDDNLAMYNECDALIISCTDYKDYESGIGNDLDGATINGSSLWGDQVVGQLRITRKTDYKPPFTAEQDIYNKILWYDRNKVPGSNFNYIDKFKVEWKE